MHTNCGIYGVVSKETNFCINETIKSLKKMQHRGQESFGIAYIDEDITTTKFVGLVKELDILSNTNKCIGHVRYSTSGKNNNFDEIQPLYGEHPILGQFCIAHNGNIPFIKESFNKFNYNCNDILTDSYLILRYIENSEIDNWTDILSNILKIFKRAFCILILTKNKIYALKDTYGTRPLSIGKNDKSIAFSSESIGFINLKFHCEVNAGEIYEIDNNLQIRLIYKHDTKINGICSFEQIYFMNQDSIINNSPVKEKRKLIGGILAKKDIFTDDYLVSGIPKTGNSYAHEYANKSRLKYHQFIDKISNLGRTFILQNNEMRNLACSKKYIYDKSIIKDNKLILIDDSLVRGITIKNIVDKLKEFGAKEIHIRIGSPMVTGICYYGIDIPTTNELIANNSNIDEICENIGADSLKFIDTDEMITVLGKGHCTGCFNGDYKDKLEW